MRRRLIRALIPEGPALQVSGASDEVGLGELRADRGGVHRCWVRGFAMTSGEMLLHDRQQQVTLLHAITAVEQPPAPKD